MKRILILSWFILSMFVLSACGGTATVAQETSDGLAVVSIENTIIAEGRLEPIHFTDVAFSAGGVVEEVLVAEGDSLAAGDLIAHLENTEVLQAEVSRAETAVLQEVAAAYEALRVAQQRVDNYSIPSKFAGMTPAEAAAAMKIKVDEARTAYEPYMGYDNPRGYAKDLKDALEDAWADYNQALEWMGRKAELDAAEIRLAQANADYANLGAGGNAVQSSLSAAQIALSNAELRAPLEGTVADLNVKVGEAVSSGFTAVTIADFSNWVVKTTDLTELDVVKISEGQNVIITLDALPDVTLKGTVESIGETFSNNQGDVTYEVTVSLQETYPAMRWGMTALVEFSE